MPRIIAALAIAAALVIGVFVIKNRTTATENSTALIAEQIQNANQSSIAAYGAQLESEGVATDTSIVVPPPTSDVPVEPPSSTLPPPTATDKLAQNILETYVNTKESGVDISSDVATQIADNIISQPYSGSDAAKTYSVADIKVENSFSPSDLKNYGNAVGKIVTTPLPLGQETELQIFSDFAASNNDSTLGELNVNIARYRTMVISLLATPVPIPFVSEHIALINNISEIGFLTAAMQNFLTDPVGATNAAQSYLSTADDLNSVIATYQGLFQQENVTFSPTEAGYIFAK